MYIRMTSLNTLPGEGLASLYQLPMNLTFNEVLVL